jgi:hypothetical protein
MTKREALTILINNAAAFCYGAGVGLRRIASEDEKRRVGDAIRKVYPDAYGRAMDEFDARNLGFWGHWEDDP